MGFGFRSLIQAGKQPEEAAREIRAGLATPEGYALLMEYLSTGEGRELLGEWAAVWAEYGLEPPWQDLLSGHHPGETPAS